MVERDDPTGGRPMKDSARYVKIVEWSEEDQCYVGSCPGLLYGGAHGDDEVKVFEELCQIVEEVLEIYRADGRPLPPMTSGRDLANTLQDVA
jgi:predicted RNase H-like HicB family nuclease